MKLYFKRILLFFAALMVIFCFFLSSYMMHKYEARTKAVEYLKRDYNKNENTAESSLGGEVKAVQEQTSESFTGLELKEETAVPELSNEAITSLELKEDTAVPELSSETLTSLELKEEKPVPERLDKTSTGLELTEEKALLELSSETFTSLEEEQSIPERLDKTSTGLELKEEKTAQEQTDKKSIGLEHKTLNGLQHKEEKTLRELTNETFVGLEHDDPSLVAYVRKQIVPPSTMPYALGGGSRTHFSQFNQSLFAEENFLHGMRDGFFIEAGALDGVKISNSLYFERSNGWTGLLIEPDPKQFARILRHHRKAYAVNAGIALTNKPAIVTFRAKNTVGRIRENYAGGVVIKVFPLYTMLLALNVHQVDFFSLDIEGDELKVLSAIPWDKIKVRLMCVEINHARNADKNILLFLESQGLTYLGTYVIDAWFGLRSLLEETTDVDEFLRKNDVAQQRRDVLKI